jgi:hypothetical protein
MSVRNAGLFTFSLLLCSQLGARTVLDGVFTKAQAARGDELYAANCARCHEGADVDGPPLAGDPFIDRWREDVLAALLTFMRTKMPQDSPGKLSEPQYVDILAHLLDANGYPAGSDELTLSKATNTQLVGKSGSKPLPSNALVRVTGCLAAETASNGTLSRAGDPGRSRESGLMPDELREGASRPLGSATYRLQNLDDLSPPFDAIANKGHKVLVKGVLVHQAAGDRINVTAIGSLADACAP